VDLGLTSPFAAVSRGATIGVAVITAVITGAAVVATAVITAAITGATLDPGLISLSTADTAITTGSIMGGLAIIAIMVVTMAGLWEFSWGSDICKFQRWTC